MANNIRVRVLCFSHIKHALGQDELWVDLPREATADQLEAHVRKLAGDRLGAIPLQVAVNQEFVAGSTTLHDGDEVAFIPPMQGG